MANFRSFNGATDNIASVSAGSITPEDAWTFGAWVNPNSVAVDETIMRVGGSANNTGNPHLSIGIRDTAALVVTGALPTSGTFSPTGPSIAAATWSRIYATKAGTGVAAINIGVNATVVSDVMDPLATGSVTEVNIGASTTGSFLAGGFFAGGVAWAFWLQGVALGNTAVNNYLNAPATLIADYGPAGSVVANALRFLYSMQCAGSSESDLSGNGAATITGATYTTSSGPTLTTEYNPCGGGSGPVLLRRGLQPRYGRITAL